jgi:tetratricopeptide (TPR) repeat protein
MRRIWLVAALVFPCWAYDLTGRIEPPVAVPVLLHGAKTPFENSTASDATGRFHFSKIPAGTYTLVISTAARGELMQTVELTAGTVNSKGYLDLVLNIADGRLESDRVSGTRAAVSATVLSIPNRATQEYESAQHCLTHGDSACALGHLRRAVEIAPRFTAAWNQLGTIAYQAHEYSDAETNFRRALTADPEAFEPLVNLGGVLLNLARPREALGYNQRAVARRPNDALANSQLGLTYFYIGDPDLAEKYLKLSIQLDPAQFSNPQLTLADIYLRRGDRDQALAVLQDFLKRHPESAQAADVRRRIAQLGQ